MRFLDRVIAAAVITATVTAYSPAECPNQRTASGTIPKARRTIAASRHLPLGTRVYIPSRGWHIVEDRMARRYDRGQKPRIDIYMTSRAEALKWGRRELKVEVVRVGTR